MCSRRLPGQHALFRRDLHRSDIGIDRAEPVGERGGEQLACGRRCRHDRCRRKIGRPAAIGRAIDDGAVAEPVGGDHHRPGDLELLLQRRGHAASRAIKAPSSAARQGVERATTSPMTRMAGPSPTSAASAGSCSRRPTAACESGPRAARQHRGRSCGIAAGRDQAVAHRRGRGQSHIDDDRGLRVGEARPVDRRRLLGAVRGDRR